MSEQRCQTCEHWCREDWDGNLLPCTHGSCGKASIEKALDDDDLRDVEFEPDRIYAISHSNEYGGVFTPPDFGCVWWEPKQAPEATQ